MTIIVQKRGDVVRLSTDGPLLVADRDEFSHVMADQLRRGERVFDFDLGRVNYIDSAGLSTLVDVSKGVRDHGGKIRLVNLGSDLKALFELTRLAELFRIDDEGDGTAERMAPVPRAPHPVSGAADRPSE
jgi:anti-sigma B factor antagonist